MIAVRTILTLATSATLAGVVLGAPKINQDIAPVPASAPVTVVPPIVGVGAGSVPAASTAPQVRRPVSKLASLDVYGPEVELTEDEMRDVIKRWRQLQARSVAAPVHPEPEREIDGDDLHRPYQPGWDRRVVRKTQDHYRERGFYEQSRWGQRGAVATNRTPNGGRSIFGQSRWARENGSNNYRVVGNRLVRNTNKRTNKYN